LIKLIFDEISLCHSKAKSLALNTAVFDLWEIS